MMLALMSTMAFSQTRTVLFHEPFRGGDDAGLINSQYNLGWCFGGNSDNWAINNALGYDVFAITKLGGGSIEISRDAYPGASGGSYSESRTWSKTYFAFNFVKTEEYRDIWFEAGINDKPDGLVIEYAGSLGAPWIKLEWTAADLEITEGESGWKYVKFKKSLPAVLNLQIRVSTTSSGNQRAMDDIRITGEYNYNFDLSKDIPRAENLLYDAVEGKELGMFLSGKAALEAALATAKTTLAGNYVAATAKAASDALKAAIGTFETNKITKANAPKINQAADQPYVFNNETAKMTVNLTGIEGTGTTPGTINVTAISKNNVCTVGVSGTGTTRTITYAPTSTYGKDVIIVKVTQQNQPAGIITKEIEMSFGIEILNSAVNYLPQMDKVPDQYNVSDELGEQTITITGLDPVNASQTIESITAVSSKTGVVTVTSPLTLSGDKKSATLKYKPVALGSTVKSDKATITLTIKDSGSDNNTNTSTFVVYVYNNDNPPAMFDAPENATIVAGSGISKLILGNVQGSPQQSSFKVEMISGDRYLKGTPAIEYTAGNHFALLNVEDAGAVGTVSMRILAGDYVQAFDIEIEAFDNPGIMAGIYDAVMWQQVNVISVGAVPAAEAVYSGGAIFPEYRDTWIRDNVFIPAYPKMTVGKECFTGACHHPDNPDHSANPDPEFSPNLATLTLKGFFIPPVSGTYRFGFTTSADFTAGIWFDVAGVSWANAACIARTTTTGTHNTAIPRMESAPYALEAGKGYPIYAVRWFTHQTGFTISAKGPNDADFVALKNENLSPLYDLIKPVAPTGVKIHTTLAEKILIEWNAASKGDKVATISGYNIYANGKKVNSALVSELSYLIEGLKASTEYNVFVTTVDELGNESFASVVETTTTLGSSVTKPSKPDNVRDIGKTGETIKLKWNIPAATGSKSIAFDVAVNGVQNNTELIYTDTFFIRKLQPETEYSITVRAYNGSMVVSDWSDAVKITTASFNPNDDLGLEFGEKRARMNIEKRNISWTEGVGINGNFKDGSLFKNGGNNSFKKAIDAYKPGIVRWGALDANDYALYKIISGTVPANLANAVSSIGKTRKDKGLATHAMNMDYCNEIGAYYSLCIGTHAGPTGMGNGPTGEYTVDYMNADLTKAGQVFLDLLEYLAGPATSPYGILRLGEGFTDPVLDPNNPDCKGIILEFGNEVWGGDSHSAPIGKDYTKYGEWCRTMAAAMRTSPYWDKVKDLIYFKYSGRDPGVSQTNQNVVRGTKPGEIHILGVSGYVDGNLVYDPDVSYNESVLKYYRLREQHVATNLKGLESCMKDQMTMVGTYLNTYFYETQSSTASYFGNLGQAVLLLDYLTASFKYGSMVPAIFSYGGGQWIINNGDTPLAHYEMARLVNTYCKGHLVGSSLESNNQVMCEDANGKLVPIKDHEPVGTTVYNNGKNWAIALFSRDYEREYTVQINLPDDIGTIKNVKRHTVTGDGTDNGPSIRESFNLIEDEAVTLKDGDLVYVPPFSMVMYTFEADDPGFQKLPLGYFDRVLPDAIELSGNFFIDKDKGSTKISVAVSPDDAFSKGIIWDISEVVNGHMEGCKFPTLSVSQDAVTVRAQGSASQGYVPNAPFWLKATLADNPSVSKSIRINITNQTAPDCGRISVEDAEVKTVVYPNPAENVLFVKTESDNQKTLTVYNESGQRVLSEVASGNLIEMDVTSLIGGKYFVTVDENGSLETVPFVKK